MKYLENICAVVAVSFAAAFVFFLWTAMKDCESRGGVYVRGFMSYTCIEAKAK